MIRIGLPQDDIEAVRVAVLAYEQQHNCTHADVAVMTRLSYHSVKDFMSRRSDSVRIVANLVAYLPLEITFTPAAITWNRSTGKGAM